MIIKRFLNDDHFQRINKDFGKIFLKINKDPDLRGELQIAFRENYFNIYYQGNSLAKISLQKKNSYLVEIDVAFLDPLPRKMMVYNCKNSNGRCKYVLYPTDLLAFSQKINLQGICQNIKKRNFSEEIVFEQSLITDNQDRDDLIMIDRQISDKSFKNQKIDILALKKADKECISNRYNFLVIEVKLGNNKELENKVASQLSGYVNHIDHYFNDYKECYEKQYQQKHELGLFSKPPFKEIEIVKPVEGLIVVGGYKHIATEKIRKLQNSFPSLLVIQQDHSLTL